MYVYVYIYTNAYMHTEQVQEVLEVIGSEVQRNKILMCRAYVDMANKMTRIRQTFTKVLKLHS